VRELTYGSLCTGYDGLGMALALAGVTVVPRWMAEVDESMSEVLKREHPGVVNVGDIKKVPWGLAPHVTIMSSGDPCQSISIAGRQLGREDERFLWPWVRKAYRAVRPDVLFFENVSNIVSHDGGRTLAERHGHLREDGYEVRWCVLGACAVGAPHHRHRYYAVAARRTGAGPVPEAVRVGGGKQICGAPRSGGRFLLPSPMARDGDGRGEGDPAYWQRRLAERGRKNGMPLGALVNLLPTPDASLATRGGLLSPAAAAARSADPRRSTNLDDAVAALAVVPLLASPTARDGLSGPGRTVNREGSDDLRTLVTLLPTPKATDGSNGGPNQRDGAGNYYLPGIANLLPTPMAERSGTNRGGAAGREGQPVRPSLDSVHRLLPTPTTSNAHGNDVNNRGELLLPGIVTRPEIWGKFAEAVALWEAITGAPAPVPTEPGQNGGRRLNPLLPEWMMGLRPGLLTDHLSRSAALCGAGNGVVALAGAAAWKLLTGPQQR
jgi:DNA (cytosine-5)-methyltransferase 1